ncbi:hypothetical protein I7I50_12606 [Histoplasma capsulatum G186AR]|uniref:Uncharacterized protein n=1 Tax=Ajellomyces capsulatus TaxID=5037 RepID=A0A8H7Y9T3_AJECA|nr:hypothetical protein I7I52_11089 [Histoplasma capsulatum]QSS70843.1 hypothetical protein I7I50_12606 [Histoplasma capsulatum G186AR]
MMMEDWAFTAVKEQQSSLITTVSQQLYLKEPRAHRGLPLLDKPFTCYNEKGKINQPSQVP